LTLLVHLAELHKVIDFVEPEVEIQGSHALSELLCGDGSIAVSVEESEGSAYVEALEVECCGDLIKDLVKASLSKLSSLEEAAERLDVHFANLTWVSNSPEETVVLHRKWQVELSDPLLELAHGDDAGLRIKRIVK